VSLKDGQWSLIKLDKLEEGTQPPITIEELTEIEDVVRNDERVKKLAKDVGEFVVHSWMNDILHFRQLQVSFPNKSVPTLGLSATISAFRTIRESHKRWRSLAFMSMIIFMHIHWCVHPTWISLHR
jgi:hypothetical protein